MDILANAASVRSTAQEATFSFSIEWEEILDPERVRTLEWRYTLTKETDI
jgi:hypothetical protein